VPKYTDKEGRNFYVKSAGKTKYPATFNIDPPTTQVKEVYLTSNGETVGELNIHSQKNGWFKVVLQNSSMEKRGQLKAFYIKGEMTDGSIFESPHFFIDPKFGYSKNN
jgi:hypothetical protein